MSDLPRPTDAELEILTVLWSRGPATVRDVHDVISKRRPAQYTTVLKLMQIMAEKGLVRRDENPFRGRDPDYRVIPSDNGPEDLLISHISINFDRTGFQEDWNVVFPLDRLRDLAREGIIGSVADTHYSFMGATDPVQMESNARDVALRLKRDGVDAAILPPV